MPTYSPAHKALAARSYHTFKNDIHAAVADFTSSCETLSLKVPGAPLKFVQAYGKGWNPGTTVKGKRHLCGRKRKISTENAELLVADLMNYAGFGLKGPFKSLNQLMKKSARAKVILQAAAAAESTVIAALRRVEPKLVYEKLTVKKRLTKKQKAARKRIAEEHLKVPDKTLELVVWVDAKSMYMTIKTRCGWVRTDASCPSRLPDPLPLSTQWCCATT